MLSHALRAVLPAAVLSYLVPHTKQNSQPHLQVMWLQPSPSSMRWLQGRRAVVEAGKMMGRYTRCKGGRGPAEAYWGLR